MPLPPNFSDAKHLANQIRKFHNKNVSRRYKDLGDETWQRNLDTPRAEERTAVTIQADDSGVMIVQRLLLYYFVFGHATDIFNGIFYGIPSLDFHLTTRFLPQVILYFKEKDSEAMTHTRQPIKAQVGFRLLNADITLTELNALATEIKNEFATPRLVFAKGTKKFSYHDKKNGYEFIITGSTEADVKDLLTKVLKLQNHTPNWNFLTTSVSERNFITPEYQTILGKQIKMPMRRPLGNVRFTHAVFKRYGLLKDRVLVDCTGYYRDALIKV